MYFVKTKNTKCEQTRGEEEQGRPAKADGARQVNGGHPVIRLSDISRVKETRLDVTPKRDRLRPTKLTRKWLRRLGGQLLRLISRYIRGLQYKINLTIKMKRRKKG